MSPKQSYVKPSDEPWLALRRNHDNELRIFQQNRAKAYAEFQDYENKARAVLLAKHRREEEEFWNKAKAATNKMGDKNGNKFAVPQTGVQSQANRLVAAPAPRATPGVKQTPAASSAAPCKQTPKSTTNTTVLAPRGQNKKATVAIIDLCSDEDEDEPVLLQQKPTLRLATKDPVAGNARLEPQTNNIESAVKREYPIPSATLELFGKRTKPVSCQVLNTYSYKHRTN
jgi:hypothetical protein